MKKDIKKDIMEALGGDKVKYHYVMQQTKEIGIVRRRWEIFEMLSDKGYSNTNIARAFKMHPTTVFHALQKQRPYPKKDKFSSIANSVIRDVKTKVKGDVKALYFELNKLGYSKSIIAKTFNITNKRVYRCITEHLEYKDFLDRKSKIVKFR